MVGQSAEAPAVSVLGTGIMGAGMARSLLREGFPVHVWNRSRQRALPLADAGAVVAEDPAEAVRGSRIVITMLTDQAAVREVIEAAAGGLNGNQVWLQCSTVGTEAVAGLAALAREHEIQFVDAPVLGTRQPAEQGKLTVFAAGPKAVRSGVDRVLDAIGQRTLWVAENAESGAAQALKLVANTYVLSLVSGVAEALSLADGLGVDGRSFLEAMAGGPLDNPYLRTKAEAILSGDYTPSFSVSVAGKDARLIVEAGERAGVRMDLLSAAAQRFRRAELQGHGGEDMAATYFAGFDKES
ncbi:NAD(P)-dependent oxidoreductase [Phaeacidiphilus oryzae]|jgi:3-hydroxyisobutyrate dehydrogenase|uniref:NAD(P)-dependent oxidoreductase n=1 Tax=Phaeacidiphilus oryzae TaxID=348818 RepID=UPI0005656A84|nr:NAD(P)-dependent oxidoreductase [Phaeacidiphilus oryzae]